MSDQCALPDGPDDWQFYHQNYARLLIVGHSRDAINKILSEIKRIQGDAQELIMRQFLNHEKEAMKNNIELVVPKSVLDQRKAYEAQNKDSAFDNRMQAISDDMASQAELHK